MEEGLRIVRAHTCRQRDRHVAQAPPETPQIKARVDILRVFDERSAAVFMQRRPPIDGAASDADRPVFALPGDLDSPVEELLDGAGTPFDPVLSVQHTEVLRGLNDGETLVFRQIWKEFVEQIRARGEIGVENKDVRAAGSLEPEVQIAGLLEPTPIGAGGVAESELSCHGLQFRAGRVIQDERLADPRVVGCQCTDAGPGVVQDLDRLTAHGQEDVDRRVDIGAPVTHEPFMA